jgi:hypothetical protein
MSDESIATHDRRIEWSRNDDPESFSVGDDTFSLATLDALDPFFDEMRSTLALRKLWADIHAGRRDGEHRRQFRDWCERGEGCESMPAICSTCRLCLGHCECQ